MEVILIKRPGEVAFSGNPVPFIFSIAPYGVLQRSQDITLQVNILVEHVFESNIFAEVKSQKFYPNADGLITIDARTILDPYLEYYMPRPSLIKPVEATQQRKRYKVSYLLEKDKAPVGALTTSGPYYIIKGGLSYEEWHPTDFFNNVVSADKKPFYFITEQKVGLNQPNYMFWCYNAGDRAEQSIVFKVYYEDGTDDTFPVVPTVITGKWGIACTPVGFTNSNIAGAVDPALAVVKYSVKVMANGVNVIDPVMFYIDHRNFYETYDLLYRNSVGGLQSIRLRGQVDFEADYNTQIAQRTVPPSYFSNMNLLPQTVTPRGEETAKYKGDTGFISKAEMNNLRDFFLSPERVELLGNKLFPIIWSGKNIKFYNNKYNLVTAFIEWEHAFINPYYTPAGLMPSTRACPGMEKFEVRQYNKNTLQIIYAMQSPYDRLNVQVEIGINLYEYIFEGNAGSILIPFANPVVVDPENITVRGRTVCDPDSDPVDYGAFSEIILSVIGNSLPVVTDDVYNIPVGYSAGVQLQGSVLANDTDPDGDALEAVAANGPTNAGGLYSINASGFITYKPPSNIFSGQDYFDYQAREVGGGTPVTGRVYINVGTTVLGVFAKIVQRNIVVTPGSYSPNSQTNAEIWIDFFGNPSGTQPLDVTGMGLHINVESLVSQWLNAGVHSDTTTTTQHTASGIKVLIFSGLIAQDSQVVPGQPVFHYIRTFSTVAGTGYIPI